MNLNFIERQEIALLDSLIESIDNLEKGTKIMSTQEYDQTKKEAYMQGQIDALVNAVSQLEARVDQLEIKNAKLKTRINELDDIYDEYADNNGIELS